MTDFNIEAFMGGADDRPIYIYSRKNDECVASISRKTGLLAEPLAKAVFQSAQIPSAAIIQWKLALKQLQPHEKGGIEDIDIGKNLLEVERQSLFLSIFVDQLNNPDAAPPPAV